MRFLMLFLCAFAVTSAKAQTLPNSQTDSLSSLDSLFSSVDNFHNQTLTAELKAFESNPKDYWMNFVPSVGVGYNLQGKPRPSISFSLNSLFQVRKQKRQVAAIKESIILKNHIERQKTKSTVSKIYQQIKTLKEDLKFSLKVFAIEKQLFEFHERQNQNHEIRPSEFLIMKIAFLKKEEIIRIQKRQIEILTLDLYETSQHKF